MLRAARAALGRVPAPRLAPAGLPRPPRQWCASGPARPAAGSRAWAAAGAAAAAAAAAAWAPAGAAAQCARESEGRRRLAGGGGSARAGRGARRGARRGRGARRAAAAGADGLEARAVELLVRQHGAEAAAGHPGEPLPTVVLVHGLDSWHGTWRATAEALALRGVRTAAVDLRGHGLSPLGRPEDFGPAQLAADVRAALRKAGVLSQGGKRIVLVGHSMGGKIALRYAADYPDDVGALVIEDMDCTSRRYPADYLQPSAAEMERKRSFDRAFADWEACRASLVSFGYGEARVDGWLKETPPRVLAQADAGLGRSGLWSAINPYAQWLARTTVLTQADAYEALHRIAAVRACDRPDLQVHVLVAGAAGTVCDWQDEPGSIRDMEGVLPGLRVTEFPSAGHSIHNSDQAGFLDHLVDVAQSAA